jgi:hypothetical protein
MSPARRSPSLLSLEATLSLGATLDTISALLALACASRAVRERRAS